MVMRQLKREKLTYGSLFTGVGGFDIALDQAGWQCLWQVEKDKFATQVLRHHWPDVPRFGDITGVTGDDLKAAAGGRTPDLIAGGFPCQDISLAGARRGLKDGGRSGLWWEFYGIIEELAPRFALIENVAGLLTSGMRDHPGGDVGAILGALGNLGYGYAYRVLDSRYTGVAQRRRRVFILAARDPREWGHPAEVLLEPGGVWGSAPTGRSSRASTTRTFAIGSVGGSWEGRTGPTEIAQTVDGGTRHGPRRNQGSLAIVEPLVAEQGVVASLTQGLGTGGADLAHAQAGWLVPFRKSRRAHDVDDYETWEDDGLANTLNTSENLSDKRATMLAVQPFTIGSVRNGENRESPSVPTDIAGALDATPVVVQPMQEYNIYPISSLIERDALAAVETDLAETITSSMSKRSDRGTMSLGISVPAGEDVAHTLTARYGKGASSEVDDGAMAVQTFAWQVAGSERTWIHDKVNGHARTLTTNTLAILEMGLHLMRVRRLMPIECERLQGFPDNWTELGVDDKGREVRISDTQRYRQMGNAVTVNVISFIVQRLNDVIAGS